MVAIRTFKQNNIKCSFIIIIIIIITTKNNNNNKNSNYVNILYTKYI